VRSYAAGPGHIDIDIEAGSSDQVFVYAWGNFSSATPSGFGYHFQRGNMSRALAVSRFNFVLLLLLHILSVFVDESLQYQHLW
jgi:hypothetical protein